MSKSEFIMKFGDVFEHSPWIAERAWSATMEPEHFTADEIHNLLVHIFRNASEEERLGVLKAHPDLAGRLAAAQRITTASAQEQASAKLDTLTNEERTHFNKLNTIYTKRFGFPFILAVKGLSKAEIIANFEARINNTRIDELKTACLQVERIAYLRLQEILPPKA